MSDDKEEKTIIKVFFKVIKRLKVDLNKLMNNLEEIQRCTLFKLTKQVIFA